MEEQSLQEKYAPHNACFGCGPANPDGVLRSDAKGAKRLPAPSPEPTFDPNIQVLAVGSVLDSETVKIREGPSRPDYVARPLPRPGRAFLATCNACIKIGSWNQPTDGDVFG